MNKRITSGLMGSALCLGLLLGYIPVSHAEQEGFFSWLITLERRKGVKPVADETYNEE